MAVSNLERFNIRTQNILSKQKICYDKSSNIGTVRPLFLWRWSVEGN